MSQNFDRTKEVTKNELKKVKNLTFTSDIEKIKGSNVYIITVPTPIDEFRKPNLKILKYLSNKDCW